MLKKLLLSTTLLFVLCATAQDQDEMPALTDRNEITTNLLDLVVAGSINVNYERLMPGNQSYYIGLTGFDTYAYVDAGFLEESTAISLRAAYLIYFSKRKNHYGFYFYPLVKGTAGEVRVNDGFAFTDQNGNRIEEDDIYEYDISGFSAGFGLGHKWLFAEKFALSLHGEISRTLGDAPEDPFGDLGAVEPRFGVNFGYRF
jgi:hypothetical protein